MSGKLVLTELNAFAGSSLPFDFNDFNRVMTKGICHLKAHPNGLQRAALISSLGCLMMRHRGDVSPQQFVDMWTRLKGSFNVNEKGDSDLRDFMLMVIQTTAPKNLE